MSVSTSVTDMDGDRISVSFDEEDDNFVIIDAEYRNELGPELESVYCELDGPSAQALGIALIRAAYELDCL